MALILKGTTVKKLVTNGIVCKECIAKGVSIFKAVTELYNKGQNVPWTGFAISQNGSSVSKTDGGTYLHASVHGGWEGNYNAHDGAGWYTKNKVKIDGGKLQFVWDRQTNWSSYNWIKFGICSSVNTTDLVNGGGAWVKSKTYGQGETQATNATDTIDLTGVSGEYYVVAVAYVSYKNARGANFKIYNCNIIN